MKFSDGVWQTAEGMAIASPHHVFDLAVSETEVVIEASSCPYRARFEDVNTAYFTVRLFSPAPNVIGVEFEHFRGRAKRGPAFEVASDPSTKPEIVNEKDFVSLTSGDLAVRVEKRGDWRLDVLRGDKRITGSALGSSGCAIEQKSGRTYVFERLDLGVGDLVYGLGERFTAFTRNGQSVEIWNRDGGTSTEQAYKNIPFFLANRGWGVLVNQPEKASFEVASEFVSKVGFSVEGESLEYLIIDGPTPKDVLDRYTRLTGRPALPPPWSFGLWLTTSFTTDYDEKTVGAFVDGMRERDLPLHVFHFDCFWMRAQHWCDFEWDPAAFPDPKGMLARLKAKGLRICVWINPFIAQRSRLFDEGMAKGYLLRRPDGRVWQWDNWQSGMGFVDFTNPEACAWYAGHLERLIAIGVDCFKTDFGERIPTDVIYFDGSDPQKMHNYYTFLYNRLVFETLKRLKGNGEAVVFARSATVGGQRFPVHWGGDNVATYESMAESLRGGLSLGLSGFGFWSHDIGGFQNKAPAQGAGPRLQALVRVRPLVQPQPAAWLHVLPRAMDLRRRGGRRAALFHQAQVPADALPLRGGTRSDAKRRANDAGDGPRVSRRSRLRDARPPIYARPIAARLSISVSMWDWRPPSHFFGFNWDWNLASVPIETENSARSGENGLSLKCGFPALHILVGDLLLPRSNRFHGKLVEHAEDFCGYAVRGPRERSQALNR